MWENQSLKNLLKYEIIFKNISEIELELFNIFLIENSIGSLEESNSKYFFYLNYKKAKKLLYLIENYLKKRNINYEIKEIEKLDESYLYKWQEYLTPIIIDNFLIKPSWFNLKTIEIDSSQAFGTGKHPTTQICINFLLKITKKYSVKTFLDAGTGSGILSIIAEKTDKIKKIIAFDNDFNAILTSKKNILKNNCKNIFLIYSSFEGLKLKEYDIVCANMLSNIILKNRNNLLNFTKKGYFLIISGIEKNEVEKFLNKFLKNDIKMIEKLKKENWYGFLFQKL